MADSPCVRGSGAPSGRLIATPLTVLCAFFALLALSAGAAHAEAPRLVPDGTFSTGPWLVDGVAVDNSSGPSQGDVYVASLLNKAQSALGHVDGFDGSGKLLSPPSPLAEGANSGTAVNPVNGDVYVLGNALAFLGAPVIDMYDPSTGALISSFPVPEAESNNQFDGSATVVQIAADSAGNVYVPAPLKKKEKSPPGSGEYEYVTNDEVLEYPPGGCESAVPPCPKVFTGGSGGGQLKEPTGVAVDSSGNVWVADHGNNRIEELSPAGVRLGEIKSEGVQDVALDGNGDVFAIVDNSADFCGSLTPPCSHLVEYSSAGVQLADVGAGTFGSGSTTGSPVPPMVAVNQASGRVYVTDATQDLVFVFAPPAAPILGKELAAEVTTAEAKLGALVDPGGIETTYRFEYNTREYKEGEGPHGVSVPFPEGSVGEDFASRTVWAAASGLAPGTTYHYRVIATNALGTVVGPDQTFTTETAEQAACPNEQLRGGSSAALPDCRAYELVTPPVKNSSQLNGVGRPAVDGDAISFTTQEPLPGAPAGGINYVATRGADGWGSEEMNPLESYTGILCSTGESGSVGAYSDELSSALVEYGKRTSASQGRAGGGVADESCNAEGLQVAPGEPVGYENLLVRDNATGTYRLVNAPPPPGMTPANAHFKGASPDLSHVVFTELAALTSDAPADVENLFEWDEGVLRLLTVLPNGTPAGGSLAAEGDAAQVSHAISTDGSHILFTSGGGLYDRIDGERTVQIDETQGGAGASGGGSFQAASTDGSKVLFLDERRLTADSTAETGEPDLYECVLPEGASNCELSDLTVAKVGEHADVLHVSGLGSKDSSHVYFTARGVLAGNTREYTDAEGKQVVEGAQSGDNNLYLDQAGTITFIATLASGDFGTGAVSPDGTWFTFDSTKSLMGYDNSNPGGGVAGEIFLYSAATGHLACASCNPSGEPPVTGGAQGGAFLSNGGRLFFNTAEALVPSDTNGQTDVYEYENGQPSLISSGTSSSASSFAGASESGGDVFFESRQALVAADTEQETLVVYDARVDGGFPATAVPPSCATADACRVPVAPLPLVFGAPASATFSGAGNLVPPAAATPKAKPKSKPAKCKRGFVKKKGKCTKKPKRKAKKSAHANKRTGK